MLLEVHVGVKQTIHLAANLDLFSHALFKYDQSVPTNFYFIFRKSRISANLNFRCSENCILWCKIVRKTFETVGIRSTPSTTVFGDNYHVKTVLLFEKVDLKSRKRQTIKTKPGAHPETEKSALKTASLQELNLTVLVH